MSDVKDTWVMHGVSWEDKSCLHNVEEAIDYINHVGFLPLFRSGIPGFISLEWFPYFANFRRDGYDFDALWDDGKASVKQKRIMDLFMDENADRELLSTEMKQLSGYGGIQGST